LTLKITIGLETIILEYALNKLEKQDRKIRPAFCGRGIWGSQGDTNIRTQFLLESLKARHCRRLHDDIKNSAS
jgi:hypothetical protein